MPMNTASGNSFEIAAMCHVCSGVLALPALLALPLRERLKMRSKKSRSSA
jgi:ABC-type spermidine/putrescine transport system permease subunit II